MWNLAYDILTSIQAGQRSFFYVIIYLQSFFPKQMDEAGVFIKGDNYNNNDILLLHILLHKRWQISKVAIIIEEFYPSNFIHCNFLSEAKLLFM